MNIAEHPFFVISTAMDRNASMTITLNGEFRADHGLSLGQAVYLSNYPVTKQPRTADMQELVDRSEVKSDRIDDAGWHVVGDPATSTFALICDGAGKEIARVTQRIYIEKNPTPYGRERNEALAREMKARVNLIVNAQRMYDLLLDIQDALLHRRPDEMFDVAVRTSDLIGQIRKG